MVWQHWKLQRIFINFYGAVAKNCNSPYCFLYLFSILWGLCPAHPCLRLCLRNPPEELFLWTPLLWGYSIILSFPQYRGFLRDYPLGGVSRQSLEWGLGQSSINFQQPLFSYSICNFLFSLLLKYFFQLNLSALFVIVFYCSAVIWKFFQYELKFFQDRKSEYIEEVYLPD